MPARAGRPISRNASTRCASACRGRRRWPIGSMPTRRACWCWAAIPRRSASSAGCSPAATPRRPTGPSCEGAPPADEGVFDQKLLKVNTRSGWSVKVSDKGQTAVTRYKVLGRGPDMTWLELKPETGRTHQIRVHCAAAGCPVIADRLYGTGRARPAAAPAFARHRAAAVQDQAADRRRGAAAVAHDRGAEGLRLQSRALTQTRSGSPISKPASSAAWSSSPNS